MARAIEGAALVLPIEGMTCSLCVERIETAVKAVPGVTGLDVSLRAGRAIVRSEGMLSDARRIGEAVYRAGYVPGLVRSEFAIGGMRCGTCRATIENALRSIRGVVKAEVNLRSGRARIEATANVALASIVRAVEKLGYSARIVDPAEAAPVRRKPERPTLRARFLGSDRTGGAPAGALPSH